MLMRCMKFGVIGTNFVTDWLLEAGKRCPGFELAAVYSRTEERARQYAEKHGGASLFTSLEALAADGGIEAVYIASPTALHCVQAKLMLEAGKHVFCEKPAASNQEELRDMLRAAETNHVLLLEAMRPAFNPGLARLKEALGEIGTVRRAVINLCKYSSRYDRFRSGLVANAFNPALSNGALMDMGVYCVHVLLRLFGKPRQIRSACVKLHNGVDGSGTILASYDAMTAELQYSKITDSGNGSEIQGEDGNLCFRDIISLEEMYLLRRNGERVSLEFPREKADMLYELGEFIRLARTGPDFAGARPHRRCSLDALEILDTVREQCGIVFPADSGRFPGVEPKG
jgi:predicted dehydrogenase